MINLETLSEHMNRREEDEILEVVIKGVKLLCQQSFNMEDPEVLQLFSSEFFLSSFPITEVSGGTISYPHVMSFDEERSRAVVCFWLAHQTETKKNWVAQIVKKENVWKIGELYKEQEEKTERVTNMKGKIQKITLVYTSYSGSNTVALYKSMLEGISDKYNVELIRQQATDTYVETILKSDVVVITEGNHHFNKKIYKPDQIIIDLWHGFPLKTMGYVDKNETYKNRLSKIWNQINYITSYSNLYNEVMNECILVHPDRYVITGQPRNDFLFQEGSRELLHRILGREDNGKNLIFYMPTYRSIPQIGRNDGKRTWKNLFDFEMFYTEEFIHFLQENNCEMVVKLHPAEEVRLREVIEGMEGVQLLTNGMLEANQIDLYEVLGAVDLLITDYSSVYFDYLLLDKPIIFTPTDLNEYEKNRGFLLHPYQEWTPGPKVFGQDALQKEIKNAFYGSQDYYREARRKVCDAIHTYQDNQSSKRIWEFIESL